MTPPLVYGLTERGRSCDCGAYWRHLPLKLHDFQNLPVWHVNNPTYTYVTRQFSCSLCLPPRLRFPQGQGVSLCSGLPEGPIRWEIHCCYWGDAHPSWGGQEYHDHWVNAGTGSAGTGSTAITVANIWNYRYLLLVASFLDPPPAHTPPHTH